MNDFTKEELEDLLFIVGEWGNHELYIKLQSMIENYPETCGLCNRTNCEECPCR